MELDKGLNKLHNKLHPLVVYIVRVFNQTVYMHVYMHNSENFIMLYSTVGLDISTGNRTHVDWTERMREVCGHQLIIHLKKPATQTNVYIYKHNILR